MKRVTGLLIFLVIISSALFAARSNPPKEVSAAQITKLLRQAQRVAVFCGDDVDPQTCKFFLNALRVNFRQGHVHVMSALFYQPETLVQSFYVPPMLLPFTDVTLRLIEANTGPGGAPQVFLGGFCFDSTSHDESGFQLPRWVQTERGGDTGPLEADRAAAASKLAQEFATYWIDSVNMR